MTIRISTHRRFLLCVTLIALAVLALARPTFAQKNDPPSGQFGIGLYSIRASTPSGLEGVYAINQNMQVGSELSLTVANSSVTTQLPDGTSVTNSVSSTVFLFGPFFRYLMPTSVSPFVQGGLQILTGGGTTTTGIFLGGGVAYNINHEIGLHAGVDILNFTFGTPSTTIFGWSIIRADADWFF